MMIKLLLLSLFAACQAAHREPWWIQMFFPNVSFTGKYHPSNYKVEKSPLFPDYVQNPNDVWSPAYWMPYKQAYSQYWIDYIENATKAEEEKAKQAQAELEQAWSGYVNQDSQYGINGQYNQNGQYGFDGQYNQNGQYGFDGQYNQNGQYGFDGQYGQDGQYGINGQYDQNMEYGTNGEYNQNGQYEVNGQYNQDSTGQTIVQEASDLAEQVQGQAENMNKDAEQIIAQVNQEAEKQMQAVVEEANKRKQEVEAQAQFVKNQAVEVSAQIDKAAEAQVEAIAQETAQFASDIKRQFAPLYEEAEKIALIASEIAENVEPQV